MLEILLALALLAGIAKCVAISNRPTTNRKCVGSLMVLLLAWMTFIGWNALHRLVPGLESVDLVLGILPSGLTLGAALLAVAGLKDYSRGKGVYTQGQPQAVTALAVSGLMLILIGVTIAGGLWGGVSVKDHPIGGQPLMFEEFNFKFLHPGSRWTAQSTNATNATLALQRTKPEVYFRIVARKTAPTESLSSFAEHVMLQQSNTVEKARLQYSVPTHLERMEGLSLYSEGEQSGRKLYYQHRLFLVGGWGYQLITSGPDRAAVANEADYLSTRFELLGSSSSSQTVTNSNP